MDDHRQKLTEVYTDFQEKTQAFRENCACKKGCDFCCSHAGRIDITTLEGMQILAAVKAFPKPRQKRLAQALQKEIRKRENKEIVPCPFLMKNGACMIYSVRPFACRRISSTHTCTADAPPKVHFQVMKTAEMAVAALQQLDPNGYTGHISYILYMLQTPAFYETYAAGEFKPEEIMVFGKSHQIAINRMMS